MMIRCFYCAVLGVVTIALSTATARADDACWRLVFAGIRHNAELPHARYLQYSESGDVSFQGQRVQHFDIDIIYRDDGAAYVNDERWGRPYRTDRLEPGPPELGPYGNRREGWLPEELMLSGRLQTIASVQNIPRAPCTDEGDELINGTPFAHLVLGVLNPKAAALKAIWIDRRTFTIPRLVVSGYVLRDGLESAFQHELADFQVDMQNVDGYAVVSAVRWTRYMRANGQTSKVDAVFTFGNYRFSQTAPLGSDL